MGFTNKYVNYLIWIFVFIPPMIYLAMINKFAINLPRQDDYEAVLGFLSNYKKVSGFDKITILFSQYCEHRAFFSKLILLSDYLIFGTFSFRHIIIFNFILTLSVFVVCVYFIKKCLPQSWRIATLVLSLTLFDLNNYENGNFASSGLFNYGIILLFMLSMLFYTFEKNKFIAIAAIIQVACIFSGGNGFVCAFFIVLYTILSKEKKKIITSVILFLVFVPLYFYKYNFPSTVHSDIDITKVLQVFLSAIGSNFGFPYGLMFGLALLILLIFVFPFKEQLKIKPEALPLLCIGGFMIASMATMAVFRRDLPIESAYSSRYMVYTHLLFTIIITFLFMKRQNSKLFSTVIVFTSCFYILNYTPGKVGFSSFYSVLKDNDYFYPFKETAKQRAEEACSQNIYCIEKHRSDK